MWARVVVDERTQRFLAPKDRRRSRLIADLSFSSFTLTPLVTCAGMALYITWHTSSQPLDGVHRPSLPCYDHLTGFHTSSQPLDNAHARFCAVSPSDLLKLNENAFIQNCSTHGHMVMIERNTSTVC